MFKNLKIHSVQAVIFESPLISIRAERKSKGGIANTFVGITLYDKEGNEIYIITARSEMNDLEIEKNTNIWLKQHGICYSQLLMNVQNKGNVSKELGLDILIDDSIHNCSEAQKQGINAILVTSSMNKEIEVTNLNRANSWIQIYEICHKIQDEKQN